MIGASLKRGHLSGTSPGDEMKIRTFQLLVSPPCNHLRQFRVFLLKNL